MKQAEEEEKRIFFRDIIRNILINLPPRLTNITRSDQLPLVITTLTTKCDSITNVLLRMVCTYHSTASLTIVLA